MFYNSILKSGQWFQKSLNVVVKNSASRPCQVFNQELITSMFKRYYATGDRAERRDRLYKKLLTLPGSNLKKTIKEIRDSSLDLIKEKAGQDNEFLKTQGLTPDEIKQFNEAQVDKLEELGKIESSFDGVYLIDKVSQIRAALNHIKKEKLIGLDLEGLEMGKKGNLSLVQISTENGRVYLFDIVSLGYNVFRFGLKEVLESREILKVVHDCRRDSEILYHRYKVSLAHIYDVQIGHALLEKKERGNIPIRRFGFHELTHIYARKYSEPCVNIKFQAKDLFKDGNVRQIWEQRPLPKLLVDYSSLDSAVLLPIYYTMKTKLTSEYDKRFLRKKFKEQLSYFKDSKIVQK
ncbi:hypothetical protein DLAC_11563 [Tieghemostelium lacteum]|uniref:3'-5' exonuclease domain-containing protein n=1 Tax=Tieghemostelium lacteum TaxID=361077 RepID=A0A152A0S7_TIELA|nr:hypothetical protein DLAC_11563 [Tieghemostelium lacteum]|eukprot:KYQ99862.1 hypothetical protein DLAC_11563 [Tieghemostelium lacteum]